MDFKINARVAVDFHVVDGKFQGSRTHSIEIFSQMIEQAPDLDFFLFCDKPQDLFLLNRAFTNPNVHAVRMPKANPLKRLFWQLPRLCRKYGIDLIHTQYVIPWPMACLRVVTIHDVLFETHPQFFTKLFVLRSRLFMRMAARSADHVFTVSKFCKKEIIRIYGVLENHVDVIYNGVDFDRFYPGQAGINVLEKRGLDSGGYILSVGRLEPRKNQALLVDAYAKLPEDSPKLVLVGQRDFNFSGVFDAISRHKLTNRVTVIEDLRDDELPALYRHAAVFAYPAFAEGFGMPVLEAMASGIPVLSSSTTAIPEVMGDCGVKISPEDVDGVSSALINLLGQTRLERENVVSAARVRAEKFDWKTPAATALNVYRKLLNT